MEDYLEHIQSPDTDSYTEYDSESYSDEDTTTSNFKYKIIQPIKKGYYKFKKLLNNKVYKIGFYETNTTPGSQIRNAITGCVCTNKYEFYKVGSYLEDLFFKVCNTTIETGKRVPIIMFFNTPEEFEKHYKCVIKDDIKTNWKTKYEVAINRYEKDTNNK